jgi:hypothetical protein
MKLKSSLSCSQKPAIGSYLEPDETSQDVLILFH